MLKIFLSNPVIDSYLFKDAINKYNTDPKDEPKALPPELKLIINKAKEQIRKKLAAEIKQQREGKPDKKE